MENYSRYTLLCVSGEIKYKGILVLTVLWDGSLCAIRFFVLYTAYILKKMVLRFSLLP